MDNIPGHVTALMRDPLIAKLASIVFASLIALLFVRLLQILASRSIRDVGARYRTRKVVGFVGYAVMFVVIASVFSKGLGQLTVLFGVVGAGIAFALQEVIASMAGWIAVSLGGFYRPGDRVRLGGITGDVIDIGVLRTTLMELGDWVIGDLYNGRIVRVANSFVFKEPVYNYSGEFSFLWDEIRLPVRFGSDWTLAQHLIESAVGENVNQFVAGATKDWSHLTSKYMVEKARIAPLVTLIATDNWIEFTARYVVDYRQRRATKDAIMRALLTAFDTHRDRVQFGSATMEVTTIRSAATRSGPVGQR